jgi:hypothetical protein
VCHSESFSIDYGHHSKAAGGDETLRRQRARKLTEKKREASINDRRLSLTPMAILVNNDFAIYNQPS